MKFSVYLPAAGDTRRLGLELGRRLEAGGVVALSGPLGSGKTLLTQGLAQGLGVPADEAVTSPSFALAHEYRGRLHLVHLDVYRLDADAFFDSGLDEYFDVGGVVVIEWAERIGDDLPKPYLRISLSPAGSGRMAVIAGVGSGLDPLVEALSGIFTGGKAHQGAAPDTR